MFISAMPAFQNRDKSRAKNNVCISINSNRNRFEFYTMENGDKSAISHSNKEYKATLFSEDFFNELTAAAESFVQVTTAVQDAAITLILPNCAVAMDTVNIPNMNRRKNDDAVDITISGYYKNSDLLKVNRVLSTQTKQTATYSVTAANAGLLKDLSDALARADMRPDYITFSANTTVNAVTALCTKLKNENYMLLDIKPHYTNISFVVKGRTVGFYGLPFGHSILTKNRVAAEDMLFDHSVAELAVLNAREKAKAKELTMMGGENPESSEQPENLDSIFGEDENASSDPTAHTTNITKTLGKKEPRKLPKFMERPQPHSDEEYSYENFRLFMKWALNLLNSNEKLVSQGEPGAIFVNMPAQLNFLFEMANAEKEENEIEFLPLDIKGTSNIIAENLDLFGGFYAASLNKNNNF